MERTESTGVFCNKGKEGYLLAKKKTAAGTKTNAMRILDKAGISYKTHEYDHSDDFTDGVWVAKQLGQPEECVFKTLVCRGASKTFYVFVVPVSAELDLKAAARVTGEKFVEMIKVDEISKVTGYIRGGCSPLGMKREYETIVDESCILLDTMIVSAGKIGCQIELAPEDLITVTHGRIERLT